MKKLKVFIGFLLLTIAGVAYGVMSNYYTTGKGTDTRVIVSGGAAVVCGLIGLGFLISCELSSYRLGSVARILRRKKSKEKPIE